MKRQQSPPPGDLVYLSERKLINLAVQLGVKTGSFKPDVEMEGTASVTAGLPSVGKVSAQGAVRAERTDPGKQEKALTGLLEQVTERLGDLPILEDGGNGIHEAGWFRFHRKLRFGVGCSDSFESVRALVVVDREHVPEGVSLPGLLMNGSVAHVRPPYSTEELRNAPGSRSGSGSGQLFIWLEAVRRELEADPKADLGAIETSLSQLEAAPRDQHVALDMYRLFAEERWMKKSPLIPELLHGAPSEGIAQASFIAVDDAFTLILASPLYVRVRALTDDSEKAAGPGFIARLLGGSAAR